MTIGFTHPTLLIIPTFTSSKLDKVGCLCLFDFMFSQLDAKHLWLNEHAYEIMYLYKYEGIMATILLLIHFISLWLTLMSLLQPCDDNCIKKNCDSTNSHASERISNTTFPSKFKGLPWVIFYRAKYPPNRSKDFRLKCKKSKETYF